MFDDHSSKISYERLANFEIPVAQGMLLFDPAHHKTIRSFFALSTHKTKTTAEVGVVVLLAILNAVRILK